jgi:hypothetical protein
MFVLNGQRLFYGESFTGSDGTVFPADWLENSTKEQKALIGIIQSPTPTTWDQRYYWGYRADGTLIPKQLEDETITPEEGEEYTQTGLKTQHIRETKDTANKLLSQTDWYVTRKFERNIEIPADVVAERAKIIEVAEEREALIASVSTVDELKGLYESSSTTDEETGEVTTNPPAMPNWV